MNLDELKEEYRSVRAPRTERTQALARFEDRHTRGNPFWFPLTAWSLIAMVVLGVVLVPELAEQTPDGAPVTELSLRGVAMLTGPAMPSMTSLSAPSNAELIIPQLSQISLSPTKETI